MARKRLVIHDWNGCLLDDALHRFEYGVCAIFKRFGLSEPSFEDYRQHIVSDFMAYYYSRGIPDSGDRKRDGDALNAIMVANMAAAPVPPLFPETRGFLESLESEGLTQVLVSALPDEAFLRQIGHHGLGRFFRETRSDVRRKAPVFRELLEKYGVDSGAAVGVTDTMGDVRELAEVGIKPIIVAHNYSVPDTSGVPSMAMAADLLEALMVILE